MIGADGLVRKEEDSFIGLQEFVVGYSKAPEQSLSTARPICHSHTMTSMGREPATIHIAAYRSSPHYLVCHRRHLLTHSMSWVLP